LPGARLTSNLLYIPIYQEEYLMAAMSSIIIHIGEDKRRDAFPFCMQEFP
jgi:hypothetical protein